MAECFGINRADIAAHTSCVTAMIANHPIIAPTPIHGNQIWWFRPEGWVGANQREEMQGGGLKLRANRVGLGGDRVVIGGARGSVLAVHSECAAQCSKSFERAAAIPGRM